MALFWRESTCVWACLIPTYQGVVAPGHFSQGNEFYWPGVFNGIEPDNVKLYLWHPWEGTAALYMHISIVVFRVRAAEELEWSSRASLKQKLVPCLFCCVCCQNWYLTIIRGIGNYKKYLADFDSQI